MADRPTLRRMGIVVLVAIVTAVAVTLLQRAISGQSNIVITGAVVGAVSAGLVSWAREPRA